MREEGGKSSRAARIDVDKLREGTRNRRTVGDRIEGVGHGECVGVSKILKMARMEHVLYLDVL
jgi:hypothetical protein